MMRCRFILIGMVLVAVCLVAVWTIGGKGEPPREAKVQAEGLEPGGSTNIADNARVLSGEVAVSPRISLFAKVFDENGNLVWEGWLENGTSAEPS
jgi:hypothetical protein